MRWMKTFSRIFLVWMPGAVFSSVAANTLQIDPALLKAERPETYIIKQGDSVASVSSVFLQAPLNADNAWGDVPPIRPGDQVSVINLGERTFLQFKSKRTVKLTPQIRVPRTESEEKIIPISSIRQFLNKPQILTSDEIVGLPYVIGNPGGYVLMTEGNQVYVRNLLDARPGERLSILRQGRPLSGGDSESSTVFEAIYLGEAEVERDGDPGSIKILDAEREIRAGDFLMPREDSRFVHDLKPRPPSYMEGGRIIALVDGLSQIGQYQVVILNRGSGDGLERGHVVASFRGGQTVRDPLRAGDELEVPREPSGTLLIFKVFPSISYALVMEATDALHVGDEVGLP